MGNLVSTISRLQVENEMLKEELQAIKTAQLASPAEVIHGGTESSQGSQPVKFITLHQPGPRGRVLMEDHHVKEPEAKQVVVGSAAQAGLNAIIEAFPHRFPGFGACPRFLGSVPPYVANSRFRRLREPFHLFYLYGKKVIESLGEVDLDELTRKSLWSLCQWMEDNLRKEWDEADALFAQGKVNQKHYSKLFQPGELVVCQDPNKGGLLSGAIVPWFPSHMMEDTFSLLFRWRFDGVLRPLHSSLTASSELDLPPESDSDFKDIARLKYYPLRFASEGTKAKLIARGQRFWACRRQKLVCYNKESAGSVFRVCLSLVPLGHIANLEQVERRFMIDYDMFKRLHPNNKVFGEIDDDDYSWDRNDFIGIEEPPDEFLYCLPPEIHGFDFTTKTWKTLEVDHITDVTWNKKAFSQLVAPPETKELIQAVVSAHGERKNMGLDIIEGKGQGLLVLLHGGPGTGKTLTAESIAEEQERPLYRVTCGDIGTEPREVERYLGDVLEIGRAWGCVVLLDEADVFLEERSFSDQKRNAIISIFLRILEYYDGILILTTNRIGSFDEAFKSRIQLALGYPRLNEEDRLKIWNNFVQMLRRTEDRIDMQDLQNNLYKLAQVEINGREIRNIITMARHLAKFRGEMLRYKHMQDAVRSAQKFSEYLDQVKGVSDDDWARADKLR
ncbi:hypothetical protein N0V84_011079 [Fusarium piperis]|uniref:AAA+ ATPase domain-containing protein n=1 Tax=Fusarium piperis TaxID=1435070 RepID=A0A9W8TCL4_9HYPO|nr:hypothetical protein N0V84_011079 [Fusarium piperis]